MIEALIPLNKDTFFVFGSNEAGIHGAGAAAHAVRHLGAVWGQGVGLQGRTYAIPTKDRRLDTLPLKTIQDYVDEFLTVACKMPEIHFQVTQLGCGLAGHKPADIAPMFERAPPNCSFDLAWKFWLPERTKFWGTVP